MVATLFTGSDLIVMAATALIGGLVIDLHKRMALRWLIQAGCVLLTLGWTAMLITAPGGPWPHPAGAAGSIGPFLAGIALLIPGLMRAMRQQHRPRGGR